MTDWLMVIITAVYVIATFVICFFNGKSAAAAKKQTEEMIRQYNESHRPIINISFEVIRSGLLCFKLENTGPVAAENINIKINDEFLDNLDKVSEFHNLRGTTEVKLMLSSCQKLYIPLSGSGPFNQIASVPAIIDISYNNKYEEHTEIDLLSFQYMLLYNSELGEIPHHLSHIERNLKDIEKETKSYHNNLIEAISNINPVSFLVNTGYERRKFETYKAVCLNPDSTTERIAEIVEISKEEALDILMELERVDSLVQAFPCDDDAFHTQWHKDVRKSCDFSLRRTGWI